MTVWGYRLWGFIADMNGDGAVSISDVWLWMKWLYFYPGDLGVAALLSMPNVSAFFEMSTDSYGGTFSGVASAVIWLWAVVLLTKIEREGRPTKT